MKRNTLFLQQLALVSMIVFASPLGMTEDSNSSLNGFFTAMPTKTNSVLSPQGMKWLAAMMYAGANTQTATELKTGFRFADEPATVAKQLHQESGIDFVVAKNPSLHIANGIWSDTRLSLTPEFQQLMQKDFRSDISACDFENELPAVQSQINEWINRQTGGQAMIPLDVSGNTKLVLVNTISFKSEWLHPFDPKLTKPRPFTCTGGQKTSLEMMQKQLRCAYGEDKDVQFIELLYAQDNLSMLFILPKDSTKMANIEKSMSDKTINVWRDSMTSEEVDCMIPKIDLTQSFDLRDVFKHLGIESPFSEQQADFSKMSGTSDLYVSRAIQNVRLQLDEVGTEASVGSTAAFAPKAIPSNASEKKQFYANEPFWFVLRDTETGTIFFLGRFTGLQ